MSKLQKRILGLRKEKEKSESMTPKPRTKLIELALQKKIILKSRADVVAEATQNLTTKYKYTPIQITAPFDELIYESETEAYTVYLKYEQIYGEKVIQNFIDYLIEQGEIKTTKDVGTALGKHFKILDAFFLSMAQSRKSRAGKTFENIHNNLFKTLSYPFDEQIVINGKPDFLMPSVAYYHTNPMDCIIFTAKRTLRERWRQIVTEGTRGLGFFLATIDDNVSEAQLKEMLAHRIYLVIPDEIKKRCYPTIKNVLNFKDFFEDFLDPAVKRWKKQGVT